MEYLGVKYELKHVPELDPEFIPFGVWTDAKDNAKLICSSEYTLGRPSLKFGLFSRAYILPELVLSKIN